MKKRLIALILSLFIVIGMVSIEGGVHAASNSLEIKASEIKKCKYYAEDKDGKGYLEINESVNLTINMDAELSLSRISRSYKSNLDINLVIKGNKKLNIDYGLDTSSGNGTLTLESGSKLQCKTIHSGTITVKEGATLLLYNDINEKVDTVWAFGGKKLISSGNIDIKVTIMNCCDIENVEIDGGKVTSEVAGLTFYAKSFTVNGGYLDLRDTRTYEPEKEYMLYASPIVAKSRTIGNSMYIKEPEGATWKSTNMNAPGVFDKDGKPAFHVIIDKKPAGYDDKGGSSGGSDGKSGSYSNEWVNGKWYDADGSQTYTGTLSWKNDATGWWIDDGTGWYPTNSWQKIDGTWYFFKPDGYMASNEYYNGYWFNKDGSWDGKYFLSWKQNSTGWWVEDVSGWWPSSSWLKIDGYWYYFDASGYMVTSQYVDGWWISADGVCY